MRQQGAWSRASGSAGVVAATSFFQLGLRPRPRCASRSATRGGRLDHVTLGGELGTGEALDPERRDIDRRRGAVHDELCHEKAGGWRVHEAVAAEAGRDEKAL